jgi:hypothetical protein
MPRQGLERGGRGHVVEPDRMVMTGGGDEAAAACDGDPSYGAGRVRFHATGEDIPDA